MERGYGTGMERVCNGRLLEALLEPPGSLLDASNMIIGKGVWHGGMERGYGTVSRAGMEPGRSL